MMPTRGGSPCFLLLASCVFLRVPLDANELLLIRDLQTDEFFRMRLIELPTLVKANDHLSAYPVAFAFGGPDGYAAYLRFVEKLGKLIRALPPAERSQ
jgi:hypothetical protein